MTGRVLALDYGRARCGVALSDPSGTLATPLDPILRPATKRGFGAVLATVREHSPQLVLIGLPLSLAGGDSDQTTETRAFAARLESAIQVPVTLYDERFTTTLAQRRPGAGSEDSRAAAVLLEEWLTIRVADPSAAGRRSDLSGDYAGGQ